MMRWSGAGDASDLVDASTPATAHYGLSPAQQQHTTGTPALSNTLTRRPTNHALVPTNPRPSYEEPWAGFGNDSNALLPQAPGEGLVAQDNVEVLEDMAAKAKREAQAKRKQIPPFVQKLSR